MLVRTIKNGDGYTLKVGDTQLVDIQIYKDRFNNFRISFNPDDTVKIKRYNHEHKHTSDSSSSVH
jgi:hypothetical protein